MREIKFRAWNKEQKIWLDDYDYSISLCGILKEGKLDAEDELSIEIMQYTGLKDKGDKEIYEGDVITDGENRVKIIYENAEFIAQDINTNGKWNYHIWHRWEVIGNIYENPELLKN